MVQDGRDRAGSGGPDDRRAGGAGEARGAPVVSVVLVGHGRADVIDRVLAALLADPGDDYEVILVHPPAEPRGRRPPAAAPDPRLHRFAATGLSPAEARALGLAAASAPQRVLVDMTPIPGAAPLDEDEPDGPLAARLLVGPALELLRVLRAVAHATAEPAAAGPFLAHEVPR